MTYEKIGKKTLLSEKFYAWIFALRDKAQIIGPEWVVDGAKVFIKRLADVYL